MKPLSQLIEKIELKRIYSGIKHCWCKEKNTSFVELFGHDQTSGDLKVHVCFDCVGMCEILWSQILQNRNHESSFIQDNSVLSIGQSLTHFSIMQWDFNQCPTQIKDLLYPTFSLLQNVYNRIQMLKQMSPGYYTALSFIVKICTTQRERYIYWDMARVLD